MRRYLRCPGAICCPARRALRAVLQPHILFCDELIADALSPLPRGCGASSHLLAAADAPWAASRADAFRIASTVALACVTTLVFVRRREAASQHAVESHSYPSASGSNPLSNSPAPDISDLGPELQAAGKSEHEPLPRQKGPRSQMGVRFGRKEAKCFWLKLAVTHRSKCCPKLVAVPLACNGILILFHGSGRLLTTLHSQRSCRISGR